MSATLHNTLVNSDEWIDIYTLITLSAGDTFSMQNIGVSDLYYSIANEKPARDGEAYELFTRGNRVIIDGGDLQVWVFSAKCVGKINVRGISGNGLSDAITLHGEKISCLLNEVVENGNILRAILLGIEIIADQEEGSLLSDVDKE